MSLGLLNVYSTRNLGDAAIYAALARMSHSGSVVGNVMDQEPTSILGLTQGDAFAACKAWVSVGGDIFNNARPKLITRRFLKNVSELRRQPQSTMLFGQSIPRSCRNAAFLYLASALKKLGMVAIRDVESHQRLAAKGVNAVLTYDTAFALEPQNAARSAAASAFLKAGLDPHKTALISLRNESGMYESNNGESQIVEITRRLVRRGHQVALLIQADGDDADTDWAMARRILAEVPEVKVLNPFLAVQPLEPWSLMTAMLGLANLVVAVRYHAAVLRLVEQRLPYVLHYSNKGADLCDRLQLPGSSLGQRRVDEIIADIEKTAAKPFNSEPYQAHVRETFSLGLKAIAA